MADALAKQGLDRLCNLSAITYFLFFILFLTVLGIYLLYWPLSVMAMSKLLNTNFSF